MADVSIHAPSGGERRATMSNYLRACQKCGSSEVCFERLEEEEGASYKTYYRGSCRKCGYVPDHWEEDPEKAVKFWNTRTLEEAAEARAEAAEAENDALNKKLDAVENLMEQISIWLYKNTGNPEPQWAETFVSVCQMLEPEVK